MSRPDLLHYIRYITNSSEGNPLALLSWSKVRGLFVMVQGTHAKVEYRVAVCTL